MTKHFNPNEETEVLFTENEQTAEQLAQSISKEDIQEHGKHFSEEKFWDKLKKFAKKAGVKVVYGALILYFTLQRPDVPKKVKLTIIGALGYFILPIDVVPDLLPGVGYVDDLGVIMFALAQVAMHVDQDMKNQAKSKLKDWFGDDTDVSEIDEQI